MTSWLDPDWRAVLRHAWSVRFILGAALLDAVSVALNMDPSLLPVPAGDMALIAGVADGAALLVRLLAQKELSK